MNSTLKYTVSGSGKEPVILIHGSMSTKAQWLPFVKEFGQDYKIITFDLIGYGENPMPENLDNYSLENESILIEQIVAEVLEPGEKYHLVGHSYGGVVALFHAFNNRGKILSLTGFEPMCYHLLDKSDPCLSEATLLINKIKEDISNGNPLEGVRKFMDLWVAPGSTDRMTESEKNTMEKYIIKMVADYRSASQEPLYTDDYKNFEFPVCLISGKQSPDYSLAITKHLKNTICHAEMHKVDGGHFSPVTHRKEVNIIINNFIKSTSCKKQKAS